MKNILVTGGAGYIGSHTCLSLLNKNYKVFVIDSFINSSPKSMDRILEINKISADNHNEHLRVFEGDITDKKFLKKVFLELDNKQIKIDGVVHLAGLKAVSESVNNPLLYWHTNLIGTLNLLEIVKKLNCKTFVFSSSATIYANSKDNSRLTESSQISPANPYGNTKASIERLLADFFQSSKEKYKLASLRYFNPIGAHPSGMMGENPIGIPNNLFPLIINTAYGIQKELKIFGNDYSTKDGTAIRDYIHVMDLADIHVKVLEFLIDSEPINFNLNIGTGLGTSVLDLVKTFERVNNIKIPFCFTDRRIGDNGFVVADNSLCKSKFKLEYFRSIEDMCRDGWKWKKLNPNGYFDL